MHIKALDTLSEMFRQKKEHVSAAVRANLIAALLSRSNDPNTPVKESALGVLSQALQVKLARTNCLASLGQDVLKSLVTYFNDIFIMFLILLYLA